MDIIEKKLCEKLYIPDKVKSLFQNRKTCFFDIETTGFSRQRDSVILIGLLYYEEDCIIVNQFFADSIKEERLILSVFRERFGDFEYYVTYNGDAFDIPFLNYKYSSMQCDFRLSKSRSIDLLKIVRINKAKLGIEDCKLKTVEKCLGINRDDKISGKESVQLYMQYLRNKDQSLKEKILMHNYDDIYYLPKILRLFDYIDKKMNCEISVPFNNSSITMNFSLDDILINGDVLTVKGTTTKSSIVKQAFYDFNYTFILEPTKGSFKLKLDIHNGLLSNGKKCFYIDKDDYQFKITTKDRTSYDLPENIIIIKEDKQLIYDSIVGTVKEIISEVLDK